MDQTKIEKAKRVLRLAAKMSRQYYGEPLIICYSGGKDSDVLLHLAIDCLNPEDIYVLNSHTTVDAPETVYHIRDVFKGLQERGIRAEIRKPTYKGEPITMWKLIEMNNIPPTRTIRYCCRILKETTVNNRFLAFGVRAAESSKRKGRDSFGARGGTYKDALFFSLDHAEEVYAEAQERSDVWDCKLIESAKKKSDLICNPIYEWTDSDVWNYIRENDIKTNPLYEKGFHRVGCIGCPMGTWRSMLMQFEMYPKHKRAYIRAFDKMVERNIYKGKKTRWKTGQEVFDWWVSEPVTKGQIKLELKEERA